MKLLLTNDDGINAEGLRALHEAGRELGDLIVIAPTGHLSGCSHQVTTQRSIRVQQRFAGRYAVEGTPADCVRLALHQLAPETAWVLSGINEGGNLGADVHHSGTVAAVREAALHGVPGIAVSHYRKKGVPIDWNRVVGWIGPLLRDLLKRPIEPGAFWNVNLPHLQPDDSEPEAVFCPLDCSPLPLCFERAGDLFHYSGNYHLRRHREGTDVAICFSGKIAITRLSVG